VGTEVAREGPPGKTATTDITARESPPFAERKESKSVGKVRFVEGVK